MKIGTRSSVMAIAQTTEIARQLKTALNLDTEIVQFNPRGDRDQVAKLDRHGGKGGAFVAEIRDAIRQATLDAAMHSLKDVPGDEETPELVLAAYLERESWKDALVFHPDCMVEDFEEKRGSGYKIGTNSVRRAAYLKRLYPACEIIHYRGAADTRIRKLDERAMQNLPDGGEVGPADGLIMAVSGLQRVGLEARIAKVFSAQEMLPAIGQGVVTVECQKNDWETRRTLSHIDHEETRICALAEREVLWILNGHCNTPISGLATLSRDLLTLDAAVLSVDGGEIIEVSLNGDRDRPRELGRAVGLKLLEKGAARLIKET